MRLSWLSIAQTATYAVLAPLFVGVVRWLKGRFSGRRGPGPLQPCRDLLKLLRKHPSVPASASVIFLLAPAVVFTCFLLLGGSLPLLYIAQEPAMDLLLVVALLGLAKFMTALAAFDAVSPFGPMSSGRQFFIHVLAEPALLVTAYILAMSPRSTTDLQEMAAAGPGASLLLDEPTALLAIGALAYVLLAEAGRLPFDNPATHLELTMIEQGAHLEYSGRALALMEWAEAMKLTFALSLLAILAFPLGMAASGTPLSLLVALAAYLAKIGVLLLGLAVWEITRGKMRLRAIVTPLMLATGVLLFTVISQVVLLIRPGT